jgi:hypothetical protein
MKHPADRSVPTQEAFLHDVSAPVVKLLNAVLFPSKVDSTHWKWRTSCMRCFREPQGETRPSLDASNRMGQGLPIDSDERAL